MTKEYDREYLRFIDMDLCDRDSVMTRYPPEQVRGQRLWQDLQKLRDEATPSYSDRWKPLETLEFSTPVNLYDMAVILNLWAPLEKLQHTDNWGYVVALHSRIGTVVEQAVETQELTTSGLEFLNEALRVRIEVLRIRRSTGSNDLDFENMDSWPYQDRLLERQSTWFLPIHTIGPLMFLLNASVRELIDDFVDGKAIRRCSICEARYFVAKRHDQVRCSQCPRSALTEKWKRGNAEAVRESSRQAYLIKSTREKRRRLLELEEVYRSARETLNPHQ